MTHPAPYETTEKRDQRRWNSRFHTGITCTDRDRTGRVVIELTTSHDKERKEYTTSVSKIEVYGGMIRWTMSLRGEEVTYGTLSRTPTDRYSARTLAVLHADALTAFRGLTDEHTACGQLAALTTEG